MGNFQGEYSYLIYKNEYLFVCVCVCLFELYAWLNRSSDCYETLSTYCLHSREGYRLFSASFLLSYAEQEH
jgi:hypothetical protein